MERFNYPNIAAARAESVEMYHLLEAESWGRRQDEQEEIEEQKAEIAAQQREVNNV